MTHPLKKLNNEQNPNVGKGLRPYQSNEQSLSRLLKKGMTTKSDLEALAVKLRITGLKINWLRDYDPNYNGPQILNLGNNTIGGTHWVAVFQDQYFDSFGLAPPPQCAHLNWVPLQVQSIKSGHCGQWALLFLHYVMKDELDQFYNIFDII